MRPSFVRRSTRLVLARRLLALALLLATPTLAAPKWYLEMPAGVPGESAARRTLALELEGIVVPSDPLRIGDTSADIELHISVIRDDSSPETTPGEWLLVRVWDRGEFAGGKRVSAEGHPTTVGRRIALAAAELVRQLAALRARKLRLESKRQQESEIERELERRAAERRRLALESDLAFTWATDGAWLGGPGLGLELNRELPWRFRTGVSMLAGELYGLRTSRGGAPLITWFDAHAGPYWAKSLGTNSSVEAGGVLALTLVDVGGGASVDGITGQTTTWTARFGLDLGFITSLGPSLRLRVAFGAGALLRPIPIEFMDTETRFGGAYLGTKVSLLARRPW